MKAWKPIVITLAISFLVCPASALDPSRRISQYAHSAWRTQDGAFPGTPNAITQTADGYIWIGTSAGLVRFDGVRFAPWEPGKGKQLPSSVIYYLLGAKDGTLWIGTSAGLASWKNGELLNFTNAPGRIDFILEDHQGTIWAGRTPSRLRAT